MTACVYVTDPGWAEAIGEGVGPRRISFWRRDMRPFKLPKGSFFYFKLRGSRQIAGRARYESQVSLSIEQAWEHYGTGNGVASLEQMRATTRRVLSKDAAQLNCLILTEPEILPPGSRPAISSRLFPSNILGGKYFPDADLPFTADFGRYLTEANCSAGEAGFETERQAISSARIGQGTYRTELLRLWSGRCALTGSALLPLIRASHMKPWNVSSNQERLDSRNGLPLAAHIDALFDAYLLTFSPEGATVISVAVNKEERARLNIPAALRAGLDEPQRAYLAYHRAQFARLESERGS